MFYFFNWNIIRKLENERKKDWKPRDWETVIEEPETQRKGKKSFSKTAV